MTDVSFIYAFVLIYNPQVLGNSNIVRGQRVVTGVECHYPL